MAGAEHTYSYLAPSAVSVDHGRVEVLGRQVAVPFLLLGFLGSPRQTSQGLLVVAEVARTRYYEPPQMVAARIRAADPVVTSNVDRLRFESFSAPALASTPGSISTPTCLMECAEWGTTNVDFNPPTRHWRACMTPTPC